MFKKNDGHLLRSAFDTVAALPKHLQRTLECSWAGTFYREFFCRLAEERFAVLYSAKGSRPNAPVNVLVGLEVLKAGHGWSDEEMYHHFCFDVQVRYALGLRALLPVGLTLRTVYAFRKALRHHWERTGEDLFGLAVEQVTDAQLAAHGLHTDQQRMDSFQIASNIRCLSRLQLLVTILQRVWRVLRAADQTREAATFAPYLKGTASQFCYRLKGDEPRTELERLGPVLQRLVTELRDGYGETVAYQLLARVYAEHFVEVPTPVSSPATPADLAVPAALAAPADPADPAAPADPADPAASADLAAPAALAAPADLVTPAALADPVVAADPVAPTDPVVAADQVALASLAPLLVPTVRPRQGDELSAASLQSPDDPQATFRRKNGQDYQGYVCNLTETCHPANAVQLIIKTQVAPNVTDDEALLVAALPDLVARTDLDALHLDGGYNGADADDTAQALGVTLHYTAIRGGPPGSLAQWLAQLTWVRDDQNELVAVLTPEGHRLDLQPGRQDGRYSIQIPRDLVTAAPEVWQALPLRWLKRTAVYALYLAARQITVAENRHQVAQQRQGDKQLRPAVEATVRSVKHPFPGGKAPVRGQIRLSLLLTASSAMTNIRRLWCYERDQEASSATTQRPKEPVGLRRVFHYLRRWWHTCLSGSFQAMFDTQSSLSVILA